MTPERIPRRMMEFDDHIGGEWSRNTKSILDSLDKSEFWTNRRIVNLDDAKNDLLKMYEEAWIEELKTKPKLRTYVKFKEEFRVEPFLTANIPKWKRSLLSQICCGTLGLRIESGRFNKTPLEHRICQLCKSGVEDEFHFLFKCAAFQTERADLAVKIPAMSGEITNTEQFQLLSNQPYVFANFISILWNKRTELINNRVYDNPASGVGAMT